MRILAIDQGTTSTRALVLEGPHARVVHAIEHKQSYPAKGWVEHDPMELLSNIHACLEAAGPADAIGIDNQGESCLAWDADTGEPLSQVIVWQDNRTAGVTERLKGEGAEMLTRERAGLPLDPYFSASKLAWLLENVPAVRRLARQARLRLGTTDAFFLQHLTGRAATDITTASRTSLMNLATGAWDTELCRLFGVPVEALPRIMPTVGDFGTTRIAGREVPIRASLVDQQAALFGHGCRKPGDAKITFGTGAFALALTGSTPLLVPAEGFLPTVAWQIGETKPLYAIDGGVYNAASALDWARGIGLFQEFAEIARFDGTPAIERGLAFVPALSGLACPHWDRSASGLFIGMSLDTTRDDMARAVLEGVALRTAEVITAMERHLALAERISIDGGLTRNRYFCQFLASALGKTVVVRDDPEITALGTALIAGTGLGADQRSATGETAYAPQPLDRIAMAERFARAVQRAKGWHGSP